MTFLERLTERAGTASGRRPLRLVKDAGGGTESMSWGDLLGLARRGFTALSEAGAGPGDRVLHLEDGHRILDMG
ncbi:MAG: hypothetical protein HY760_02990 [Nitrospirae bacterium]|nr:hypothetical protein [Nitrospirota bacterium]